MRAHGGGAVGGRGRPGVVSIWISKPIRPAGEAVCLLERVAQPGPSRRPARGSLTFGRVSTSPPGRPPAASRPVRKMSRVRMPRSRTAASMHFIRMPGTGRRRPRRTRCGDQPGGARRRPRPPRRRGACRSRPRSRCGGPRRARVPASPGPGRARAAARSSGRPRTAANEAASGACASRAARACSPQVARGAGGEGVGGHVDGVHGLPGAGIAGVAAVEFGVDRGEQGADIRADRVAARLVVTFSCAAQVHASVAAGRSAPWNQHSVDRTLAAARVASMALVRGRNAPWRHAPAGGGMDDGPEPRGGVRVRPRPGGARAVVSPCGP